MQDGITNARLARETLAAGLGALQSDPHVPSHLLDLAAPIAKAMGALHHIERSGGAELSPHTDVALEQVRIALAQLQSQSPAHPAIHSATAAVAQSLSHIHALAKLSMPAPAPPRPAVQSSGPAGHAPAAPKEFPMPVVNASPSAKSQASSTPAAPSGTPVVNAELGAHSPSNFYKGLSGNDIIDHGGLFVSTYKIPNIGSTVILRVTLPGGYEFEATGVVRWSREAKDAADASPPGFGLQFTHITQEARQLVYRYARNREPLFHDDL